MSDVDIDIDDILNDSFSDVSETSAEIKKEDVPIESPLLEIPTQNSLEETSEETLQEIESLLGSPEQDVEESKEVPVSEQRKELESLRNRLKMWTKSCQHKLMDLRTVDFVASADEMYLKFQETEYYPRPLYFKSDPNNPTSPKVIHAANQFSKLMGIPLKFFLENRPKLKMDIVRNYQAGLEALQEKAQCLMHFRESRDCSVIRAFTPVSHSTIANYELVDTIIEGSSVPLGLLFVHGDEKDDLILHARILFLENAQEVLGRKFCMGFSLVASELGESPLIVDACIHDVESNTSYMASYGKDPYFKSKYEILQPKQIKEIFVKLVLRIQEEASEMVGRIAQRVDSDPLIIPSGGIISLNRMKGITSKVSKAIYQEMSANESEIVTPLDFARHVSMVAKDFDSLKRLEIERAAGTYLNLIFNKV